MTWSAASPAGRRALSRTTAGSHVAVFTAALTSSGLRFRAVSHTERTSADPDAGFGHTVLVLVTQAHARLEARPGGNREAGFVRAVVTEGKLGLCGARAGGHVGTFATG